MKQLRWMLTAATALLITTLCFATFANSPTPQIPAYTKTLAAPTIIPPAPDINARGYVLMDANTGQILAEKNMNKRMAPASLTKLMTLYITATTLAQGQINITDKVRISKAAWKTGGSRMFVKLGSHVPLQDLIEGIIVASGNDACVAVSEYIAGSQNSFAQLMNQTAAKLGMKNSHFVDATGLPRPGHYSTPYDLAILVRAIITHYPQYYHWYKQKWITWNGIKQPNRNRLLWRDTAVDGLKTGHTSEAGYCLITSGMKHGMRLISVVMGTPSDSARANDSQALLNWGFRFYNSHKLFSAGKSIATPRVWLGASNTVPMGLTQDLYVTIPMGQYNNLKANLALAPRLTAPIVKGKPYGNVVVTLGGKVIAKAPLVALASDQKGGLWSRFIDHIALFFKHK